MRKRSQWGARPSRATLLRLQSPVNTIFVHHSVSIPTANADADIRNIQAYHLDGRKYSDIAYNLLVHPNGTIYQGRFIGDHPAVGAHTGGYNNNSFGICVVGNFETTVPDARTLKALQSSIDLAVSKGWVARDARIRSHSEVVQTACCGRFLRENLDTLTIGVKPQVPVEGEIVKELKAFLVTISCDGEGNGWTKIPSQKWGRDPVVVGYTINGPEPAREGYWRFAPSVKTQAHGGGAIVSATGAGANAKFDVWVTLGRL